ncbi:MAG: response regulator [Alphaproteobacteria bacterium]|jgi:CheY-like chemotaxis protein|nr:MAG: response regulator [Alphaproteobacteria bacterium]
MNFSAEKLTGQHVLIVEDEYFLAQDLVDFFQDLGVQVLGPAASVSEALKLLESAEVQGAILDVNLRGERVYPVADALRQRHVPFVFASGYGGELEPRAYADVPRCIKPVDFGVLVQTLVEQMDGQRAPRLSA